LLLWVAVRNLCKFPLILDGEQTLVHTPSNPCNLAGSFFCSFASLTRLVLLLQLSLFCPSTIHPVFVAQHRGFSSPSFLSTFIWKPFRVAVPLFPSFGCRFGLVYCAPQDIETNDDTCNFHLTPLPRYPLD